MFATREVDAGTTPNMKPSLARLVFGSLSPWVVPCQHEKKDLAQRGPLETSNKFNRPHHCHDRPQVGKINVTSCFDGRFVRLRIK